MNDDCLKMKPGRFNHFQTHSADRLGCGKILVNDLMVGLMFCYLIGGYHSEVADDVSLFGG